MRTRLFPSPTRQQCTPYVACSESEQFGRLLDTETGTRRVELMLTHDQTAAAVRLTSGSLLRQYRTPDRHAVRRYLAARGACCTSLIDYLREFIIVPSFSLSREEALIKGIIRQVVRAAQAKRIISDFIKTFGISDGDFYAFPSVRRLSPVSVHEYRELGLGMKAQRIYDLVQLLGESRDVHRRLAGVGPWTKAVVHVDLTSDFRRYPFHDKSGERLKTLFGIDLVSLADRNALLAADVYVYAASYLESNS